MMSTISSPSTIRPQAVGRNKNQSTPVRDDGRGRSWWQQPFCMDVRSLALFRIMIGALTLSNVIFQFGDISAFYTDDGVLPREALISHYPYRDTLLNFHMLSGSFTFQTLLFCLAGVCAFALLIGFQTRWATICCWLLINSMHSRNPLIIDGDVMLRLLLFWSIFLPLGACYSVDRALNSSKSRAVDQICSVATVAFLLQLCFVYWFSAAFKSAPEWQSEGTAIYYALSNDEYATRWGQMLLNYPLLLRLLTHSVFWTEALGPCFLFVPFFFSRQRTLLVLVFASLHLGFTLCLTIGQFSFYCIAAWLALLPSGFWDAIARRWPQRQEFKAYYDGDGAFCRKLLLFLLSALGLPTNTVEQAKNSAPILHEMRNNHAWLAVDVGDNCFIGYSAFVALVGVSRFAFFSGLLKSKPFSLVGEKFHQTLFNYRVVAGDLTGWLVEKPVRFDTPAYLQAIAACALVYILSWNFYMFNPTLYGSVVPQNIRWVGTTFGIDQAWQMFSSFGDRTDQRFVMFAQLNNGETVDLFRGGQAVSWKKPEVVSALFKNYRWRKYTRGLRSSVANWNCPYYSRYMRRQWDSQQPPARQIKIFKIYAMNELNLPGNKTKQLNPTLVYQD